MFNVSYDDTRKFFSDAKRQAMAAAAEYDVLIVPTYLYKRPLVSGADLSAPRKGLQAAGFTCYFVETADDGPIESNAEIVMTAIRAHANSGRRLLIVSASKSGAEVALALTT